MACGAAHASHEASIADARSSRRRRESGKMEARRESAKGACKKNLDGQFPRGERAAPAGRSVGGWLAGRPTRFHRRKNSFSFCIDPQDQRARERKRERQGGGEAQGLRGRDRARVSAQMFNGLSDKSSIIRCEMMNSDPIQQGRLGCCCCWLSFSASCCRSA